MARRGFSRLATAYFALFWRDGRAVECARFEIVLRLIPVRGFESPSLRHVSWIKMLSTAKTLKNDEFFGVFCCFSGKNVTFVLRKNRFRFYAVFYLFLSKNRT